MNIKTLQNIVMEELRLKHNYKKVFLIFFFVEHIEMKKGDFTIRMMFQKSILCSLTVP